MRKLIVEKITGFSSSLPFRIFDERGIEFYNSDFTDTIKNGKTCYFNLPKGIYNYDGFFIKLQKPVDFPKITLPTSERNFPKKKYKIVFSKNPNKCSINHLQGVIVFDNAFRIAPKYILFDIYFHELGHLKYSSEEYADMYATKRMLELGFNPSQIGRSILVSLRPEQMNRKIIKINSLDKKIWIKDFK